MQNIYIITKIENIPEVGKVEFNISNYFTNEDKAKRIKNMWVSKFPNALYSLKMLSQSEFDI